MSREDQAIYVDWVKYAEEEPSTWEPASASTLEPPAGSPSRVFNVFLLVLAPGIVLLLWKCMMS